MIHSGSDWSVFVIFIYIWVDCVWPIRVCHATVKKCHPILFPVTGNMTCMDILEPFSFGSRCNFTCQEGYHLRGEATLSCLASGEWSGPPPACTGGSLKTQKFLGKQKNCNASLTEGWFSSSSGTVQQPEDPFQCHHAVPAPFRGIQLWLNMHQPVRGGFRSDWYKCDKMFLTWELDSCTSPLPRYEYRWLSAGVQTGMQIL